MNAQEFNPHRAFDLYSITPEFLESRVEISALSKLVYSRLCRYHGKDGPARPSVDTLASAVGASRRSVFRCLKELKSFELISVVKRDRQSLSSEYHFLIHPWMFAKSGLVSLQAPEDFAGHPASVRGGVTQPEASFESVPAVSNVRPIAKKRNRSADNDQQVNLYPGDKNAPARVTTRASEQAFEAAEPGANSSPVRQKTVDLAAAAYRTGCQPVTGRVTQDARPGDTTGTTRVPKVVLPSTQGRESKKRGGEECRAAYSPPIVSRLPDGQSRTISRVLAIYDYAHVKVIGRHYVASEEQDAAAALFAWDKASAIAQCELEEKDLPDSELDALRTKVLEHWSRKLVNNRDYAASKGYAFWTLKSMITQLGTPFTAGRRTVAGPGVTKIEDIPRQSNQELADGWREALEAIEKNRCYGDIGGA